MCLRIQAFQKQQLRALDKLELFALHQIENENLIYQQDGTPSQYVKVVRDFLDETFLKTTNRKAWSTRSLDVTPADVYLWGNVYSERFGISNT